jgi:cobalt transporter subunit CbtB
MAPFVWCAHLEGSDMSSISGLLDNVAAQPNSVLWRDRILPALLACGLGCVLIFGMGFVGISAIHNAAHDGRHSAGFPCH